MVGIYKITSPSGRIYIGQSIDIKARWKKYYKLECKDQRKLYNSLVKYTPEKHIFEIVEECVLNNLNEKENYYIIYFNSIGKGLNIREAGNHGHHSDETKLIMSEKAKLRPLSWKNKTGIKLSKEHCNKISASKINHLCYNDEWYIKMMEGRKNIIYNRSKQHTESIIKAKSIAILQLDKNNNIINKWRSAADAARHLDGFNQPNIQKCVSGKSDMYKGYKWIKLN
jgi:group I intron endonuclease